MQLLRKILYFLVGGTQTNSTVIDGVLDRHEGVLAAESGHINVHESGAIEATGHKVLAIDSADGISQPIGQAFNIGICLFNSSCTGLRNYRNRV